MRQAHTVDEVRRAEEALMATLPTGALMARAATGLAVALARMLPRTHGGRVLVLAGGGNNGGDALYAGAQLARRGVAVRVLPCADGLHAEALAALRRAGGRLVELDEAVRFAPELVVDGVLGIGGRPGLPPGVEAALAALADVPVVAVDLPSGLAVDAGEKPAPHVWARATVTFGTHKVATLVDPAAAACGELHLVDIGLGPHLPPAAVEALDADDVAALLPRPGRTDHKYTRGVVGVRSGSATYPGAALLCVAGAASGLAGMERYVGPAEVAATVRAQVPEVVGAGRVQAWTVGSGGAEEAEQALAEALADGVPVVVDADAIAHLPAHLSSGHDHVVVLTPHAGELAALLGTAREEVEARPLHHVREAAARLGATVLLKGARTLVATPSGRVRANTTGTPALATAGAGDVLAGLVGALLATGLGPLDAASVGAWVHGRAGERAARASTVVASDVAHAIRGVLHDPFGANGRIDA